jgi:intracellular sulfur oxidation DsrE/DsrF family protein
LRGLKSMMKLAYEQPPQPPGSAFKLKRKGLGLPALAASVVLTLGVAGGWLARDYAMQGSEMGAQPLFQAMQRNAVVAEAQKIIVHVGSANPVRLKAALDETESLLASARQAERKLQVEIIANGGGVDLLRANASPFAQRIGLMRAQYPGLGLVVCGQTLGKLKEKGVEFQLLPQTEVATSAADQITRRLHQGWDYIKA